ncbi:hypothetical protein PsYK624_026030 [Phanerochaete sordida]|uniref:F-box domain-containing protein n=1 Tax=Phanerochaete sordida TaxID=48140 RepID=A0A9P3G068_9APHY|nr:hypothetical protein PsYK624_026030 [Phanerochaete sordida]
MLERASYAPVYTLPEDVLRLIFEVDFKHDSHAEAIAQLTSPNRGIAFADPLLITHVCRRWRQTALALPTIWRCVHVNEATCRHEEALDAWLERARSMSVRLVCEVGADEGLVRDRLRGVLPRQACRLESVAILKCTQSASSRSDIATLGLPDDIQKLLFSRAPAVPSLAMYRTPPVVYAFLLADLRRLELHEMNITRRILTQLSRAAPNLSNLTLRQVSMDKKPFNFESSPIPPAIFPRLQTLTLRCTTWLFLEELAMPVLESLILQDAPEDMAFDSEHRDGPAAENDFVAVRYLTLVRCVHTHVACCRVLFRRMPEVTSVELCESDAALALLGERASGDGFQHLLPHTYALSLTKLEEENYPLLIETVRVRREVSYPLAEIRLGAELRSAMGEAFITSLAQYVTVIA